MSIPERVILVHKGALGDFLQVWPSLYALAAHWPEKSIAWAGREAYQHWIEPLGIVRSTPAETEAVNSLYTASSWPPALEKALVIWFGLQRPPTGVPFRSLWFLAGLEPAGWRPPREIYAETLVEYGIMPAPDWPEKWRHLFAPLVGFHRAPPVALLFPGAGHQAKCWPLSSFLELAASLASHGVEVRFVLGPAELERGLSVKKFERIVPKDLLELQEVLAEASLVIGNDSGPLHLSALMGLQTLGLFGPTSPEQWGPWGARTLCLNLSCSPCSRMGRIQCPDPQCLHRLTTSRVAAAAEEMLNSLL